MKRIGYILTACVVIAWLTGCSYESRKTIIHEPGVYKGSKGQVLSRQQQQELIDRFTLVQTDR